MTQNAFVTTVVGSMPKREWLFKSNLAVDGKRDHFGDPGTWQQDEPDTLSQAMDDATRIVLREQERAGIDIVSDGEQRRKNYVVHHTMNMHGFDYETLGEKTTRGGRRTVMAGRCVAPIEHRGGVAINDLKFAMAETDRPVKVTLPGPMTVADSVHDAYYNDEKALAFAWAAAINAEAKLLAQAGAAVVQIDEPVFSRFPQKVADWGIAALDACIDGVDATTAVHVCYGYPQPGLQRPVIDSYGEIIAELEKSRVDQLALEFEGPALDVKYLAACPSKTVLFGCVFNSDDSDESPRHVADRLLAAAEFLPPQQIQAAPDCGLVMMTPARAREKLAKMAQGAQLARNEI
jgi:5-methyltetrahydropteroyltriglutamate--homocysteine methyltransferase